MNYGKILKNVRTYNLITQEELANTLGISKKTYGLYETQEKIIPLKHLNKICNYFKISIDYILGLTDIKNYLNSQDDINIKAFSKRLKAFRLDKSLTQKELAKQINIDRSTLSNYENNKSLIDLATLYSFCKKYHISADYLLGKINDPKYL